MATGPSPFRLYLKKIWKDEPATARYARLKREKRFKAFKEYQTKVKGIERIKEDKLAEMVLLSAAFSEESFTRGGNLFDTSQPFVDTFKHEWVMKYLSIRCEIEQGVVNFNPQPILITKLFKQENEKRERNEKAQKAIDKRKAEVAAVQEYIEQKEASVDLSALDGKECSAEEQVAFVSDHIFTRNSPVVNYPSKSTYNYLKFVQSSDKNTQSFMSGPYKTYMDGRLKEERDGKTDKDKHILELTAKLLNYLEEEKKADLISQP